MAIERSDHTPRASFARFLGSVDAKAPDRTLFFLHLMLPHAPWRLLPSGREYGNAWNIDGMYDDQYNKWSTAPRLVAQGLQRHLLQVGYTDRLLGVLLDRLRKSGLYDRSLVILTADHGVSFATGGSRRLVTPRNLADIAAVPLFVKYPAQRAGRVDRRAAKTIDILPTIADVVGVRLPWHVDGRSLRGAPVDRRVAVMSHELGFVSAKPDAVAAGVIATARRNALLFGAGADSMYRLGPHEELLGRAVSELAASPSPGTSVHLDGAPLFADVRKASGFVPARVVGDVQHRALPSGTPMAIAVNGRIAATTVSYSLTGHTRFAALVPESAFREGANTVDVYVVESDGNGIRLARVGGTGQGPQYALSADGTSIALPTGGRARIVDGGLGGRVESSVVEGKTVRFRGWAADLKHGVLVDQVLLFAGQRLLFAADTDVYRWDIPGVSDKPQLERVGWVAEIPEQEVRGVAVRAFAVRRGVASELEWPAKRESLVALSRAP
jgi:hypothetical protein